MSASPESGQHFSADVVSEVRYPHLVQCLSDLSWETEVSACFAPRRTRTATHTKCSAEMEQRTWIPLSRLCWERNVFRRCMPMIGVALLLGCCPNHGGDHHSCTQLSKVLCPTGWVVRCQWPERGETKTKRRNKTFGDRRLRSASAPPVDSARRESRCQSR